MFTDYVLNFTAADYDNKMLITDYDGFEDKTHYSAGFIAKGFDIVFYKDDLSFRIEYEDKLKNTDDKLLVIEKSKSFIPYDIRKMLQHYTLSFGNLFPKLNSETLAKQENLNLDLLASAYQENFDECRMPRQTEAFLKQKVYSAKNVSKYLESQYSDIMDLVDTAGDYHDWIRIAEKKAKIDVLATKYHLDADTSEINRRFENFILSQYGKLSSELDRETPVLVSRAMEYMHDQSDKFIIIVMDGMSEFDWEIISQSFVNISYHKAAAFAMIPTTTSVSRQCLLSNKYPSQLIEPWKQSKEKQEFTACAKEMGYTENQIGYARGFDAEFNSLVRCGAVIINDVDEIVHAQHQGRLGMLNDIEVLAEQGKLAKMTKRFLEDGFDVYITADHGNTPCVGLGLFRGAGVEVETKSHRMIVLQNYADKDSLKTKYGMIDYPKYYLSRDYDYLICDIGDSLDAKGENVMTHGGISLDEVIVPFIKIKAEDENG